jgi:hypothetical protein
MDVILLDGQSQTCNMSDQITDQKSLHKAGARLWSAADNEPKIAAQALLR